MVSRLFVAVRPPVEILDRLADLPRPAIDQVRWTERHQWHVTLRFLGSVEPEAVRQAFLTVDSPPVEATLGPAVTTLGRRVVVAPVAGLDPLAEAVVAAMEPVAVAPPEHAFVGHLTLARARRGVPPAAVGAPIAGTWRVDQIELISSELHPNGARHSPVATRGLSPR